MQSSRALSPYFHSIEYGFTLIFIVPVLRPGLELELVILFSGFIKLN
jgi:hypothetical protein